jgi:hypothetical protein
MKTLSLSALSSVAVQDLPPDRFFSDPHLIDTVIGKRKGH